MQRLHIALKNRADYSYDTYDILISGGLINKIAGDVRNMALANRYAIITDNNVRMLYGEKLLKAFKEKGLNASLISFKAGEKSKNRKTKERIENLMIEAGFGRDSAIIALGGGVVGDLAGFVAATFNRGVPFMQIPTTLLAQVDSSIGGKVGVNTEHGKNLIGVFYQPKRVYIDVEALNTLPEREIKNGIAEIIKHAVVRDALFFSYIEKNVKGLTNPRIIESAIKKNCEIKKLIVEQDEKETGLRKIVNFGHTIGHAVEQLSNYELTHGEAVAIGMVAEAKIAEKLGLLKTEYFVRIRNLIKVAGLPIRIPVNMEIDKIIKETCIDKKTRFSEAEYILVEEIGKIKHLKDDYSFKVPTDVVKSALKCAQNG